jgi:hypothetical protein
MSNSILFLQEWISVESKLGQESKNSVPKLRMFIPLLQIFT